MSFNPNRAAILLDIQEERERQEGPLGYDQRYDDGHTNAELVVEARWKLHHATEAIQNPGIPDQESPRVLLVQTAALCVAELERMERAATKAREAEEAARLEAELAEGGDQ